MAKQPIRLKLKSRNRQQKSLNAAIGKHEASPEPTTKQ